MALKLFGSKARGDGHSESDVDVLVVVTERTRLLNDFIINLVCDIINSTGVFLEVVTYSRKEFENAQELEHPFAQNIARDSVAL